MSISEFVESKTYKNIMKFVYGWGASVVLAGALFKIQHWPGASLMLTLGMTTEVIIFFLSAFEPLHEELDWTLVYPELAGMTDDFESSEVTRRGELRDNRLMNLSDITSQTDGTGAVSAVVAAGGGSGGGISGGAVQGLSSLENVDKMFSKLDLDPDVFAQLGIGLNKMSNLADKFGDLDETLNATGKFTEKISTAANAAESLSETCLHSSEILKDGVNNMSESYTKSSEMLKETVNKMSETYLQSTDTLKESVNNLSESYLKSSDQLKESFDVLSGSYTQSADIINKTGEQVSTAIQKGITTMVETLNDAGNKLITSMGNSEVEMQKVYGIIVEQLQETTKGVTEMSQNYSQNLEKQNTNLSAINSIYEVYLRDLSQQSELVKNINDTTTQIVTGANEGLQQTITYKDELNKLNNQLSQLNNVYGSMLSTVTMND